MEKEEDELLRCYLAGENVIPAAQIGFSSAVMANFRCPVCGYEWKRSMNKATRKEGRLNGPACNGRILWGSTTGRKSIQGYSASGIPTKMKRRRKNIQTITSQYIGAAKSAETSGLSASMTAFDLLSVGGAAGGSLSHPGQAICLI